jgi:GNAT superfamily N-acetyltransferase
MIFRAAMDSDAAAISELVLSFRDEYLLDPTGRGAEEFLTSVSAEAERGYIGSTRYYYLLGEVEGALAGVIALRDKTHVYRLFVARNFQRQGLARELWRRARQALGPVDQAMNFTVNSSPMAVPILLFRWRCMELPLFPCDSQRAACRLTNRWSARVENKVPSQGRRSRGAQLKR